MKFSAEEKRGVSSKRSRKTILIILGVLGFMAMALTPLLLGGLR